MIKLSEEDRCRLEALTRKGTAEARMVERARIVLAAAAGMNNADIADDLGIALNTVIKWRKTVLRGGYGRPGRPQTVGTTEAFSPSGSGRAQGAGVRVAGHHRRAAVEVELRRVGPGAR